MNASRRRELVARLERLERDQLIGWQRLRDLPDIAVRRQTEASGLRAYLKSLEREVAALRAELAAFDRTAARHEPPAV